MWERWLHLSVCICWMMAQMEGDKVVCVSDLRQAPSIVSLDILQPQEHQFSLIGVQVFFCWQLVFHAYSHEIRFKNWQKECLPPPPQNKFKFPRDLNVSLQELKIICRHAYFLRTKLLKGVVTWFQILLGFFTQSSFLSLQLEHRRWKVKCSCPNDGENTQNEGNYFLSSFHPRFLLLSLFLSCFLSFMRHLSSLR